MSSFLEDLNSSEDPGAGEQSHSAGESAFLIGLQESDAAPAVSSAKRSGIVALAIAVACAGGGLYVMRTVGLSANIALADAEIDYTVQHGVAAVDHKKLIADLQRTDSIVQVPLAELPMNPFAWNAVKQVIEEDHAFNEPQEDPSERLRRERLREIESAFGLLSLNSILNGPRPVVRISGETYTIGDVVEEFFVVEKVHGRSVTLGVDGRTYELTIGQ